MLINKWMVEGRLGKDPEINYGNLEICKFSIAVQDNKKVGGEWVNGTMWVNCTAFGKTAVKAAKELKKGMLCLVEGKLSVSAYINKLGDPKPSVDLSVNFFKALEKFERVEQEEQQKYNNQPYQNQDRFEDFGETPF